MGFGAAQGLQATEIISEVMSLSELTDVPASGIVPVASGGTALASGTSGGVLGYTATGTLASSVALAANGVVLGGGAGATPTATAAGTANQVLRVPGGGGAPAFGTVNLASADAVTGTLPVTLGGTGATTSTGSGAVVLATSPTLTTPAIGSFVSSGHTHQDAAGGGTLDAAAIAGGILAVARGGTGIASGTSGGILGYTAAGTIASSAALTASGVVLGGGAGATPTATAAGTANQVLRVPGAGGAPVFGQVNLASGDAVTGTLPVTLGGTGTTTSTGTGSVVLGTAPTISAPTISGARASITALVNIASTELTIATGAVTAVRSHHTVDTEADAASDDLDTISGGVSGDVLVLRAENDARTVVIRNNGGGTGNIRTAGARSISLDDANDTAMFVFDGTNWLELGTSDVAPATYTVTNSGVDRAYNADSTTVDELADVLGTLIADLRVAGIVR